MIAGIGSDIIDVARFNDHIKIRDERFFHRLFTEAEVLYCSSKREAAQCFAARFAAKEAFFKALGTGLIAPFSWHDVEIAHNIKKNPFFLFSKKMESYLRENNLSIVHLSISHTRLFALAMVVIEKSEP